MAASVLDSYFNIIYPQVLDAAPQLAKLATRLAAGETGADLRRDAGLVLFEVQELWRCALRVARARSVAFEAANFADVSAVSPADAAVASAEAFIRQAQQPALAVPVAEAVVVEAVPVASHEPARSNISRQRDVSLL